MELEFLFPSWSNFCIYAQGRKVDLNWTLLRDSVCIMMIEANTQIIEMFKHAYEWD